MHKSKANAHEGVLKMKSKKSTKAWQRYLHSRTARNEYLISRGGESLRLRRVQRPGWDEVYIHSLVSSE